MAQRARRFVRGRGCANTIDLADEFQESSGSAVSQSFVIAVVSNERFEWLDQENGWFWYKPKPDRTSNRLVNYIRRILAVSPTVQLAEIRAALRRHFRTANFAPPIAVLSAICDRISFAERDHDVVKREESALDWNSVLGPTETIFKEVLQAYGPVLRRDELLERCLERGMNENTFTLYSTYSPILTRPATGLYALVGAAIPPGTVEAIRREAESRKPIVVDHGWLADGRVFIVWKLSKSALFNGILTLPKHMTSFVEGGYELVAAGEGVGRIDVRGQTCWNVKRLLRRMGAEVDDNLAVVFDLGKRQAIGLIADHGVLSDLMSGQLAIQSGAAQDEDADEAEDEDGD
jgi:hypothetical protein